LNTDYLLNGLEREGLDTLSYFPVDTNWRIEAHLIKDKGKRFKMPTSTDRQPMYRRYGWLCIEYKERIFRLAAYQNLGLTGKEYKNYLFIPFKDSNAPETTYGAGRYVEVYKEKGEDTIIIDFNSTYNPYCVYSHRYSCPVTPKVNHLDFPIEAGERNPISKKQYK
jgi:uncharacterized protein (DUF1684 family)